MAKLGTIRSKRFRVMARVIFLNRHAILATEGKSSTKDSRFFILPGGTVEFGETSKGALIREMYEELHAKLRNVKYLGVMEHLFSFKGGKHHEIAFIYSAQFSDKSFYRKSMIEGVEDTGKKFKCSWIPMTDFKNEKHLVPAGILKLLKGKNAKEKHLLS